MACHQVCLLCARKRHACVKERNEIVTFRSDNSGPCFAHTNAGGPTETQRAAQRCGQAQITGGPALRTQTQAGQQRHTGHHNGAGQPNCMRSSEEKVSMFFLSSFFCAGASLLASSRSPVGALGLSIRRLRSSSSHSRRFCASSDQLGGESRPRHFRTALILCLCHSSLFLSFKYSSGTSGFKCAISIRVVLYIVKQV